MTRLRHPILLTLVLAAPLSALSGQGPGSPVALVATTRDLNGFPLNPTWAAGAGPVDIDRRCGFFAGPGQPGYRSLVVRNPECLVGADVLRMNEARDPKGGGLFCRQGNDDGLIQGHVHWYPVTMTGRSTWKSYAEDGDYTLLFEGDGPVAQTTGNVELGGIELEFNSTETMLRLRQDEGRWWTKLHRAAIESKAAARALLTATPTIVTGLFGIDGVHGYPIESIRCSRSPGWWSPTPPPPAATATIAGPISFATSATRATARTARWRSTPPKPPARSGSGSHGCPRPRRSGLGSGRGNRG